MSERRTIIGAASAGPQLVVENTRSWEWESFARREPRRARDRLPSLRKKKVPTKGGKSGP